MGKRLSTLLGVLGFVLIAAAPTPTAQAQAAETSDPLELGWKIYQQARQAAGAKPDTEPLRDCTFELATLLQTPQGEAQVESKMFLRLPLEVRQEVKTPGGNVVIIFDGEKSWQNTLTEKRPLPPAAVEQIRADVSRSLILFADPPEKGAVRFLRREDVEGRPADVVQIDDIGQTPLRLYVDAETRDVVKKMFVGDTPAGMAQVEEFYSDFREVDGYRWPHHRRLLRNQQLALESRIRNLRINTGLTAEDILR
jgi:hypothetical protein